MFHANINTISFFEYDKCGTEYIYEYACQDLNPLFLAWHNTWLFLDLRKLKSWYRSNEIYGSPGSP